MIDGIRLKICGLTSLVDAEFADRMGADDLGFILHEKSPRSITLRDYRNLVANLPTGRHRVAVMVEPPLERLAETAAAGFDGFQLHFRAEFPLDGVTAWSRHVGADRLILAPRREPGFAFDERWLDLADTILVDTFVQDRFGGSGRTGDWAEFARLRTRHRNNHWVLAGGLTPDNIARALRESGTSRVDANSGVEAAPGVKDHARLRALVLAIHEERRSRGESPDQA